MQRGGFLEEVVCETNQKESVGISPFCLPSGYQASSATGRNWQKTGERRRGEASMAPTLCFGCCPQQKLYLPWPSSHVLLSMAQLMLGSSAYHVPLDRKFLSFPPAPRVRELLAVGNFYTAQCPLFVVSVKAVCCIIFPLLEMPKVVFVYLSGPCLMQNPRLSNWRIVF